MEKQLSIDMDKDTVGRYFVVLEEKKHLVAFWKPSHLKKWYFCNLDLN